MTTIWANWDWNSKCIYCSNSNGVHKSFAFFVFALLQQIHFAFTSRIHKFYAIKLLFLFVFIRMNQTSDWALYSLKLWFKSLITNAVVINGCLYGLLSRLCETIFTSNRLWNHLIMHCMHFWHRHCVKLKWFNQILIENVTEVLQSVIKQILVKPGNQSLTNWFVNMFYLLMLLKLININENPPQGWTIFCPHCPCGTRLHA